MGKPPHRYVVLEELPRCILELVEAAQVVEVDDSPFDALLLDECLVALAKALRTELAEFVGSAAVCNSPRPFPVRSMTSLSRRRRRC